MISVREVLLTGRSASAVPGAHVADVTRPLGERTDRSPGATPLILVYGPLELIFRDRRLSLTSYRRGRRDPHAAVVEDLPVPAAELEALLRERGLTWEEDPLLTYDGQVAWRVSSGALLLTEAGRLTGVQVLAPD